MKLEDFKRDEYGTYNTLFYSQLMGQEVKLSIDPGVDGGAIEEWQQDVLEKFIHIEQSLADTVYTKMLAYYLELLPDLQAQFGEDSAHLVPTIATVDELKKLITPTGICIGSLYPAEQAVGLLFECTWEMEHGLGVLLKNWQVDEISHQDVAFTI